MFSIFNLMQGTHYFSLHQFDNFLQFQILKEVNQIKSILKIVYSWGCLLFFLAKAVSETNPFPLTRGLGGFGAAGFWGLDFGF